MFTDFATEAPRDGFDLVADPARDNVSETSFRSLLTAYTAEGYEQGYARGTRDLLALWPLLIEQFLHARTDVSPETRQAVRAFGRYVEARVDRDLGDAGFDSPGLVDGAGI